MNSSFNVSYSALDTYQQCPKKYDWSYNHKLTRAQYEATPASLGTAIHAGLAFGLNWYHATGYDGSTENAAALGAALDAFFKDWSEANEPEAGYHVTPDGDIIEDTSAQVAFKDMADAAYVITLRTLDHLDVPHNWRTVELDGKPLIEHYDTVDLGPAWGDVQPTLTFQIDWVARNLHNDMLYVIDWKSRKSFQPAEYEQAIGGEDFNTQITLYAAAMRLAGLNIAGTITYQIAPYVPETPARIKNGRLSRANIRSDWAAYSAAIRANGEDPNDPYYDEMREKLAHQVWWSPVTIYRSDHELETRWQRANQWAKRMYEDSSYLASENIMCRTCPFARLCIGVDRNLDLDSIIGMEYTKKVDKETGAVYAD